MPQQYTRNTQAYRQRKRDQGICIYGGCWIPCQTNRAMCAEHLEYRRWYYAARKRRSVTTARNTRYTRAYRQRKQAHGICIIGGCWEPAMEGIQACSRHRQLQPVRTCLDCDAILQTKARRCPPHTDAHKALVKRAYDKAYTQYHKAFGICTNCTALVEPGHTMCAKHLEYYRVKARARYSSKRENQQCTKD